MNPGRTPWSSIPTSSWSGRPAIKVLAEASPGEVRSAELQRRMRGI
ncbi:hypothetical protein ACFVZM_12765 [Streptomyces sioyaensis]